MNGGQGRGLVTGARNAAAIIYGALRAAQRHSRGAPVALGEAAPYAALRYREGRDYRGALITGGLDSAEAALMAPCRL